jgi:hypothetical protein
MLHVPKDPAMNAQLPTAAETPRTPDGSIDWYRVWFLRLTARVTEAPLTAIAHAESILSAPEAAIIDRHAPRLLAEAVSATIELRCRRVPFRLGSPPVRQ